MVWLQSMEVEGSVDAFGAVNNVDVVEVVNGVDAVGVVNGVIQ